MAISSKTTFVIGAGASCDFGFPTSDSLVGKICRSLDIEFAYLNEIKKGSREIVECLWRIPYYLENSGSYLSAAKKIVSQLKLNTTTIDDFLNRDSRTENEVFMAKLAIAIEIINCEKRSELYDDYSHRFNFLSDTVKKSYLHKLFRNLVHEQKGPKNNYDRCVE